MSAGLRGIFELQGIWLAPSTAVPDVPRQVDGGRGVVSRPRFDHIEPTRADSVSRQLVGLAESYERTRRAEKEPVTA